MALRPNTSPWMTVGIIISWITFWMFLSMPFGLIAWLVILIYLAIREVRLKWYLLLSAWVFVPGCNFLTGSFRYFTGTASLHGVGGPETYHGIDIETRAPIRTSGCIVLGFEPFVFVANNTAVRLWSNLFGYQRGSYTGILPTHEEALEIIKTADTLCVVKKDSYYQFNIQDNTILLDTSEFRKFHYKNPIHGVVVGKVLQNECLLIQLLNKDTPYYEGIYLADIKDKKVLRKY